MKIKSTSILSTSIPHQTVVLPIDCLYPHLEVSAGDYLLVTLGKTMVFLDSFETGKTVIAEQIALNSNYKRAYVLSIDEESVTLRFS